MLIYEGNLHKKNLERYLNQGPRKSCFPLNVVDIRTNGHLLLQSSFTTKTKYINVFSMFQYILLIVDKDQNMIFGISNYYNLRFGLIFHNSARQGFYILQFCWKVNLYKLNNQVKKFNLFQELKKNKFCYVGTPQKLKMYNVQHVGLYFKRVFQEGCLRITEIFFYTINLNFYF